MFDSHGRPLAILRGRAIALVLGTAYTWTFQFSNTAGIVTVVVVCALGPWLLMRAQQFSLANTSYRGLRFGFTANTLDAYRTLSPVILAWLAPGLGAALTTHEGWFLGAWMLALPWMHHRLKRYQRFNASYGDSRFTFTPALGRFYWIYTKGSVFVVLGTLLWVLVTVAIFLWQGRADKFVGASRLQLWIYGALAAVVVYVAAGPYLAARLQQLVWSRTRLGDIRFRTDIRARPLLNLVAKYVALSVVTAGLYWPFAAIALVRYRIESIRVESDTPLSALVGTVRARVVGATGDGAADAFGIDIGL